MIVVVAGPAGSGKSTLGLSLARALRLPYLDLDTMTNPVLEGLGVVLAEQMHWNDPRLREVVRPARYRALRDTLADQVAAGLGAVLVAPFTAELQGGDEWDKLVDAADCVPAVVWVRASPALLAERRAARAADRDAHIVDAIGGTPPAVAHLAVDAALPTAEQVQVVLQHPAIADWPG
ncbi:AAA family ATPase [Mycetocola miduiensis]|uniref:Sugar-phosphatase n=1 Tax=Mycetocola miduiensis TaxID=995034 RepID=A0A1I4YFH1_9MICO|nr:AAA family ATPase [Mycetocola miduiensis]SFN36350.1 sugar-phosphatase [Mycetocola miduiensis]